MNQQMHNELTNYYTAPTCFNTVGHLQGARG